MALPTLPTLFAKNAKDETVNPDSIDSKDTDIDTDTRQDRDLNTRERFQRQATWAPAALLPEIKREAGWAYRWIRTSMAGQADATNVSSKMREGWEPVSLSAHPELHLYIDGNTRFKDSVEVGGLLLCKTPEEFVEQRTAYYSNQTQAQSDAVDNSFMKESDKRMPLFKEKSSATSFGRKKTS